MTKSIPARIRSLRGPSPAVCGGSARGCSRQAGRLVDVGAAGSPGRRGPFLRSVGVLLVVAVVGVAATACDGPEGQMGGGEPIAQRERQPVHVDSVFPIQEEVRRFRIGLSEPSGLTGGASSAEELTDTFIRRLSAGDTLGLAELALTREEFAWLYYLHTIYTSPPYELSPALVWFQLQNRSSRGLNRALQRYAGEELHHSGLRCPDQGEAFGEGWIHHGCAVLGRLPDGTEVEERLFGSILALDGRYKLVGFSNEL